MTASGIQTQGDKQSRRHDPGASVTAIRPQILGDTGRRDCHSIWHLTSETGRHRGTAGDDPGSQRHSRASVTASQRLRNTGRRHSIWPPDTGRQAGDTTPELATQKRERETRPRSQRHSIWPVTAETGRHRETSRKPERHRKKKRETPWSQGYSIWHLTGETGRQEDKRKTGPGTGVTLSHSLYLKLEPQCFAVWGKNLKK